MDLKERASLCLGRIGFRIGRLAQPDRVATASETRSER
jgi:hypothetical protein